MAGARAQKTVKTEPAIKAVALLLVSSAVVAVGLFLVFRAKTDSFSDIADKLKNKQVVSLNTVSSADDLVPLLTVIPEGDDRQFAAKKIYEYIVGTDSNRAARREISSIYDLARLRIEEKEVNASPQLDYFKKRFADERERLEAAKADSKKEPGNQDANKKEAAKKEAAKKESADAQRYLTLPLLTRSQLAQLKSSFVVREPSAFRNLFFFYAAVYIAIFYLVFIVWRARGLKGDSLLLPIIHILTGIGFMAMIGLRDPLRDAPLFTDFAQGAIIGAVLMLALGMIDYQAGTLRKLSFIPLILSFALSAALILFGKGPAGSDAKVNLLGFQPVEVIKILIVLFLAGYFASNWEMLRELAARPLFKSLRWLNVPRLQYVAPLLISMAVVLGFFFFQKDLGPALILACSFLALYGVARNRFALVGSALLSLVLVFYISYRFTFPAKVAERISMWTSPWDNMVVGGDQLAHSLWALSTGSATGTGLGLGEPGYIPAGHTDLIGSTVSEELGFFGLLAIFVMYATLIFRSIRISLRAPGDYSMLLGIGLTIITAVEVLLIGAGTVGLLPLSGVTLPFLSFGKSSMIAHFAIFGILMSISARKTAKPQAEPFRRPVRWVGLALLLFGVAVIGKAAHAQLIKSDDLMIAGSLAIQGDGSIRYQYNPRILEVVREIPRGSILDRSGLPLATSRWEELEKYRKRYEELGVDIDETCSRSDKRHYPFAKSKFGGSLYHLLGDIRYPLRWNAADTSYVERDSSNQLQGFDDKEKRIQVKDPRSGALVSVETHDYHELIPLIRNRYNKDADAAKQILNRNHDVRLTIDVKLQLEVAKILKQKVQQARVERGAIVVVDPKTGDLLASVSYPWPENIASVYAAREDDKEDRNDDVLIDRARWGAYAPGSTFKIVTAIAALRQNPELVDEVFKCESLNGRPGVMIPGYRRPVYDDESDSVHGDVTMSAGVIKSCNPYFAQLGVKIGSKALLQTAKDLGILFAEDTTAQYLRDYLPWASFGQHPVLATPFQMARVAATIANDGTMLPGRWVIDDSDSRAKKGEEILEKQSAREIGNFMRGVVTKGTAADAFARGEPAPIAGKTGTAQVQDKQSHSWFIGFAPFNAYRQIAFAVIIENAGYGARFAAPAAGDVVQAALKLKIIE